MNAKAAGAKVLIVLTENKNMVNNHTKEGVLSDNSKIPVVKMSIENSNLITNYASKKVDDITISINFAHSFDNIYISYFLRSDNIKSLYFMKEFYPYYKILRHRLNFYPNYKFYECLECEVSTKLTEDPKNSCLKSNQFCGYSNDSNYYLFFLYIRTKIRQF